LSYTPNAGYQGPDSFSYTISDGELTSSATVSLLIGEHIDVWYGDTQKFGAPGEAQTWVNILGDVFTENLASLHYSLNGGSERTLTVGPDNGRLAKAGDFNVDIAFAELDGSSLDDIVTIIARYGDGTTITTDVTIDYEEGAVWNQNYSIDWSTVTNIQDVVQVVDGKWALTGDGLRPEETGYDRFVIMGDDSWDFYEARVSVTTNDLSADFGLFGFGLWWTGHTDDPNPGLQPKTGFNPSDLLFYNGEWAGSPHFEIYRNIGDTNYTLESGVTYNFVIRAEQLNQFDRLYKMKVWEDGAAEPVDWLMAQPIEQDAPVTGAFGFVAHHYDITFHDVAITEIEGGDITKGTGGADMLAAVNTSAALPGVGEIDVFVGGEGPDIFMLGAGGTDYYDDGVGASAGLADYGYVWDFVSGQDQIQLGNEAADYVLTEDAVGLPAGTAIWRVGAVDEEDELIGVLNGAYGLSLVSDDFIFNDLLV
ncbi:Ig-like domain-containing protein, partial [Pontibaca salina]